MGRALQDIKLGTVEVAKLGVKHSEMDFLRELISTEVANNGLVDAVVFAGPKTMLDADVPRQELRRMEGVECPVFYINYNSNSQAVPWKDSISHAIRALEGTEYAISRPRDLWLSTSDMFSRIISSKRQRAVPVSLHATGTH